MKDMEVRLGHVEILVRKVNDRLKNIIDSRTHYLRHKAKKNGHTMQKLRRLVRKLEHLEQVVGSTTLVRETREGDRTIVLFTQMERKKLRAMLAADYHHVFKCTAADARTLQEMIDERSRA